MTSEIIFIQRKPRAKHCRYYLANSSLYQINHSAITDQINQGIVMWSSTGLVHELYLVRSHMWWETAAEKVPVLLHKTGSHEPTSTVSPQTEPCHENTPINSQYNSLCVHITSKNSCLPFQDQVEPVSEDGHPDEPEPSVPPQVEPDGEEAEVRGVQVGHRGRQAEQTLIAAVSGLQMDRQLDPPAVEKIHDITTSCLRMVHWIWVSLLVQTVSSWSASVWSPIGLYSRLAKFVCLWDGCRRVP